MRAGRLARLCVVPALAGLFLIATAAPAWAHAILQSTDPPKDGVAAQSPSQLSLTFNENVEVSFGAIRVLHVRRATDHDGRSAPLADERSHRRAVDPEAGVRRLPRRVARHLGRLASRERHVLVPHRARTRHRASNGCATETNAKSSTTVGALFGVARAGVFAGLALLIGGVVFLLLIATRHERGSGRPGARSGSDGSSSRSRRSRQ